MSEYPEDHWRFKNLEASLHQITDEVSCIRQILRDIVVILEANSSIS